MEYRSIPLSLFCLAIAVSLLPVLDGGKTGFRVASLMCGIGFGACFVLYAAQTTTFYGMIGLGRVYPLLFLFYGGGGNHRGAVY